MPASSQVLVLGLSDLNRALQKADRDVRLGIRDRLKDAAEPVRADAQGLAVSEISRIGVPWSRMRIGVVTRGVYLAPVEKGVRGRGRGGRRRPNLATRLMEDAMRPAVERNAAGIERRVDQLLETVADDFNRGGII